MHVRVDLQRSEVDALRSVLGSACDRMCLVDPNKRPSLREVITMLLPDCHDECQVFQSSDDKIF